MRSALAYAEQHTSIQVQSDAQSAAALRSVFQTTLSQLRAETAVCHAAQKQQAEATSEFTARLKLMRSRLKDKFEERELALLHELAVQKDEFRQLQVKVAAARPPLRLDTNAATSSRVAPNVRTDIDWYDISSQKSDDNTDLRMWQQNLPHITGITMPMGLRDSDGTLACNRED